MPLNEVILATQVAALQKPPLPPTPQLIEYCGGLIDALKAGTVAFATGTITGITASGAPLVGGSGTGGTITTVPAPMISRTSVAMPDAVLSSAENTALINYIVASAKVSILPVNGQCTNTPVNPGPLAGGFAASGTISGLSGTAAANAVIPALGGVTGPEMIPIYDTIMTYLMTNALISFPPGTITGTCPPGGGSLELGTGAGGTIK